VSALVEHHLPDERREKTAWRYVSAQFYEAALDGEMAWKG